MATAKKPVAASKAVAPARRAQLTPQASGDPIAAAAAALMHGTPKQGEEAAAEAKKEGEAVVHVNVPTPFRLTLDNLQEIQYHVGAQKMPLAHAEHWYAKANGVEIVK